MAVSNRQHRVTRVRTWAPGALAGLWLLSPQAPASTPWDELQGALQRPGLVSEAFRDPLARFYAGRQGQPLWFNGTRPTARVRELRTILAQADREGLNPADYAGDTLHQACDGPAARPLACELRLSDSLLRYASDVGYGLLRAADEDPNWHIPQASLPAAALLDAVAAADDLPALLAQLPPADPAYRRLRAALADYRRSAVTWFPVPDGPSLRPGEQGTRVQALRERLGGRQPALLGVAEPQLFDPELGSAVRAFQGRHGLEEDGIVGRQTLAALNVTPEQRIAQLRLNMERWRWLPRELGARHILVNLAGFDLTLVQPDRPPLRLRVISGRPDRTSPAFASRINRLVLNPDWTVPRRIAVEEMLPQLKRDPLALQGKDIQVLRRLGGELVPVDPAGVDWRRYHRNNFPFVLRQLPGPHNSLGRLKFVMPNPFDVYIHDTPAKGLFAKSVRTLSHGCIRVEQPLQLASQLLDGGDPATVQELQAHIDGGVTDNLPIRPSLPVYLVYLTAWVDEEGNLQWRNDVYNRNVQLRDRFSFP